jgi:hypothetical protein
MPRIEPGAAWVLVAVVLYGVQAALGLSWGPLGRLQDVELYRWLSGAVLAGMVLFQVFMAIQRRLSDAERARVLLRRHRLMGAACLGMLFLHTTHPGYGYLLVLGLLIPIQVALGALWPAGHGKREQGLRPRWRMLHGILGLTLVTGLVLHVWMVFAWA